MRFLLVHYFPVDVVHLTVRLSFQGCRACRREFRKYSSPLPSLLKVFKNRVVATCVDLTLIPAWVSSPRVYVVLVCAALVAIEPGLSFCQLALPRALKMTLP